MAKHKFSGLGETTLFDSSMYITNYIWAASVSLH